MSMADGAAKRGEKQRGTEEETSLQLNYRSPLIKRRDEPMKNQNRATGREKIGEGAIRKRRTQVEIATKQKIAEDKDTKEKVEQKNMMEEKNIKL